MLTRVASQWVWSEFLHSPDFVSDCKGDIGGPLLEVFAPKGDIGKGMPRFDILVGISSFVEEGVKCGAGKKPGVYTRMSSFREWVDEKVCSNTSLPLPS